MKYKANNYKENILHITNTNDINRATHRIIHYIGLLSILSPHYQTKTLTLPGIASHLQNSNTECITSPPASAHNKGYCLNQNYCLKQSDITKKTLLSGIRGKH